MSRPRGRLGAVPWPRNPDPPRLRASPLFADVSGVLRFDGGDARSLTFGRSVVHADNEPDAPALRSSDSRCCRGRNVGRASPRHRIADTRRDADSPSSLRLEALALLLGPRHPPLGRVRTLVSGAPGGPGVAAPAPPTSRPPLTTTASRRRPDCRSPSLLAVPARFSSPAHTGSRSTSICSTSQTTARSSQLLGSSPTSTCSTTQASSASWRVLGAQLDAERLYDTDSIGLAAASPCAARRRRVLRHRHRRHRHGFSARSSTSTCSTTSKAAASSRVLGEGLDVDVLYDPDDSCIITSHRYGARRRRALRHRLQRRHHEFSVTGLDIDMLYDIDSSGIITSSR